MSPMMQMGGMPAAGMPMGQPMPPPQPPTPDQIAFLDKPSWEQVISLMRDNAHRNYRIDIETDSTIAGSLESDMQGLGQIMQAVSTFMGQVQPLVQSGMLPMDAAKEILMTITRRARMGNAVEDALDKMVQPKPQQPQPDPRVQVQEMKSQADGQKLQSEQQHEAQMAQMQAMLDERDRQSQLQFEQQKLAMDSQAKDQESRNQMAVEQHQQQMQAQQITAQNQLEAQRAAMEQQAHERLEQMRIAMESRDAERERQFQLLLQQMKGATAVEVAEVNKAGQLERAQVAAANTAAQDQTITGLPNDAPVQPGVI